jgi:hypothetical protein
MVSHPPRALLMTTEIPNTNEISSFFHCASCMDDKPPDLAPREWVSIEAGFTPLGFQVWCKRCECNIIHIDFEGVQHPANVERSR